MQYIKEVIKSCFGRGDVFQQDNSISASTKVDTQKLEGRKHATPVSDTTRETLVVIQALAQGEESKSPTVTNLKLKLDQIIHGPFNE